MNNFSHLPMQTALFAALSADSTLAAQVSGIFDRPPQGSAYPYVTLGEAEIHDLSNLATRGSSQIATLHIWSREGGRAQAATIMDRIYTLLHQANLTVAGQTLVTLEFAASSLTLESDGWTYHGIMRFSAILQAS